MLGYRVVRYHQASTTIAEELLLCRQVLESCRMEVFRFMQTAPRNARAKGGEADAGHQRPREGDGRDRRGHGRGHGGLRQRAAMGTMHQVRKRPIFMLKALPIPR